MAALSAAFTPASASMDDDDDDDQAEEDDGMDECMMGSDGRVAAARSRLTIGDQP